MFSEKEWTNTDDKMIFDVYIAMIIFELLPEWNWKNIRQLEDNLFIKLSSKHFPYSITNHDKEHDVAWNRDRTQKTGTKIHKKVITASEENEKWGKIEALFGRFYKTTFQPGGPRGRKWFSGDAGQGIESSFSDILLNN